MPRSKTDFTNFIDTHPNYFAGQYLLEDDFEVQHQYLSDRQLYHQKSLHVSGILEGLEVEVVQGQKAVSIKSGSAIDGNGNLIVLKKDIPSFGTTTTGELYIEYKRDPQLKQQNDIPDSFTRWQELPSVQFAAKAPDSAVKLASIAIANDVVTVNLAIRAYSGVFLPNALGNDLTLRSGGNANPNLAILNGSLSVTGDLAVTGNITGKIDTANITSGILSSDRIPNLSSDKITTGTLNVARIPNLSADKITAGTITGNLTITGNTNIGATAIGSQVKIDLSGNLHLKEFATGNLAFLQARDDTSNRDIGLRIRTQLKGAAAATIPTLVEAFTITPSGNVGVGIADPSTYKLNVQGDQFLSGILAIGDAPFTANTGGHREWMTRGIKVFWNSDNLYLGLKDEGDNRKDAVIAWGDDAEDNLRFIYAGSGGAVQGREVMKLKSNGDLTITGNTEIKGTMTGAANAYQKAQFTMSGGGTITWGGVGGRLKWTTRFIAISMERSTNLPNGHINILQPTIDLPAIQVYDGNVRSANANGVLLKAWEALYAVHTLGGNEGQVSFQIVRFTNDFNAPSNWILVAVVNEDDNTVKLGTGEIIGYNLRNDVVLGGTINADGGVANGAGFSARRSGTGLYEITFSRGFSSTPSVVVTQYFASDTGNTLDNAVVTSISTASFKVHTGSASGSSDNRAFSFICIGSR
jgi:hypothetical protein